MVGIYGRQSLFKRDSLSIEQQVNSALSLCNQNNWEYNVYSDAGYSGKDLKRPAFTELMADVQSGKVDKILCYKFDRISRNIADFCMLLEELQKYHCEFISISENFDTSSPIGRAMVYICMVFAQMERESISQRVHDNYYYRTELGFWGGGAAPYGYQLTRIKYKGKVHTVLEPESEQSKIVQDIYSWYLEPNESASTILDRLNNQLNIPSRNGAMWTSRVLMDILSRPLYAPNDMAMYNYLLGIGANITNTPEEFDGNASVDMYGKKVEASKYKRCRKAEDMYCNISSHDAIIDSDTWIRVQHKRQQLIRKPSRAGTGKNSYFTGLMKCELCGTGVSYTSSRGTMGYYICSSKKNRGYHSCSMKPAPLRTTDPAIIESIITHYSNPDIIELLKNVKLEARKEAPADIKRRNKLLEEAASIQTQIDNLMASITFGNDIMIKYINDKIVELDSKKGAVEKDLLEMDQKKSEDISENEILMKIGDTINEIPKILTDGAFDEIRDLCKLLVQEIIFKKDGNIDVKCTV